MHKQATSLAYAAWASKTFTVQGHATTIFAPTG